MAINPIHFDVGCLKTLTAVEAESNRSNQPHRSAEYRLYFQSTPVMDLAKSGDTIVIGKCGNHFYCELIQNYQASSQWVDV